MRSKSQLVLRDSSLTKPSALPEFLGELQKNDCVSGYQYFPPRPPQFADFPQEMYPQLQHALKGRGIEKLYTHQARAFELARSGKNVVVVTPTASGKTLCYNLPVLQRCLENSDARALCLYPTKALTNIDFYIKLTLITLAMIVMQKLKKRAFESGALSDAEMMLKGKALATWALVFWAGAVTAGRLLAYTYNFLKYDYRG